MFVGKMDNLYLDSCLKQVIPISILYMENTNEDEIFAPAGFWPRGQNPRRHPRIPRVYTYKEFQNVRK